MWTALIVDNTPLNRIPHIFKHVQFSKEFLSVSEPNIDQSWVQLITYLLTETSQPMFTNDSLGTAGVSEGTADIAVAYTALEELADRGARF